MKLLIIRFSSFGDIIQTSAVLKSLKKQRPELEIHWLVRSDMKGAILDRSEISKLWVLDRHSGLKGIKSMAKELSFEHFDYVYDAHGSIRSKLISLYLRLARPTIQFQLRPKYRLRRVLLFKLGINTFPRPYKSMLTYWLPLKHLLSLSGDPEKLDSQDYSGEQELKKAILLAPSAAWKMKRWPLDNFKKLIQLMPKENFVILGGKEDHFCQELEDIDPLRVKNLAGKLSLKESCQLVANGKLLVSADTGLIHVADIYGANGIMLYGPTAFGGTTFSQISILKSNLECMPCTKDGRGQCSQEVFQKCMIDITPEMVVKNIKEKLAMID